MIFSGLVLPATAGHAHPLLELVAGVDVLQVIVIAASEAVGS